MSGLYALASDPLAIVVAILALGVLIIVHEGGHYLVARWSGMRIDRFAIGFGPSIAQFQRGETTFQIGMIPLGGYVQIAGLNPHEEGLDPNDPRSYPNRPLWQRMATIFAGPGANYLFAVVAMVLIFVTFGVPKLKGLPMVIEFGDKASPAQVAGMELMDEVVSVDGKPVKTTAEVSPIVNAAGGRPLEVVVMRAGRELRFQVTPQKIENAWRIGVIIQPREEWTHTTLREEVSEGVIYPFAMTAAVFHQFAQIFKGKQEAKFSGPIGIVRELKRQILRGTAEGLQMAVQISVLLGLFNLFPIPALDGGRLVFLLYEMVTRRRANPKIEAMVHMAGIMVLGVVMVLVTLRDFHVFS
jgi:regulator of sigma E protease